MRVLIVDDESAARRRLSIMLDELDVEVVGEARDGVEALQIEMSWAAYMETGREPAKAVDVPPFDMARERLRRVFSALLPNAVRHLSSE